MKRLLVIVITLFSFALSAEESCNVPLYDFCVEYHRVSDSALKEAFCVEQTGEWKLEKQCSGGDVVLLCRIQNSEMDAVTYFYSPRWNLNEAQVMCFQSGGSRVSE